MNPEKILESLDRTIKNCDKKATSILAALGIVFGFSLFSAQPISNSTGNIRIALLVFACAYILLFSVSFLILIYIVFPRRMKNDKLAGIPDYPGYSEHVYEHVLKKDLGTFIKTPLDEQAIIQQISTCSKIAHKKEMLLKISIFLITTMIIVFVPMAILMIV